MIKTGNAFASAAAGLALIAAAGLGSNTMAGQDQQGAPPPPGTLNAPPRIAARATVIDLADPLNPSPAVNHIVSTVKEALAANQKVIVLVSEEHTTVFDVKLAEFLRAGLQRNGVANPVMAVEQSHNLLEILLSSPQIFPGNWEGSFRTEAASALSVLKTKDLTRYHRLQAMAYASIDYDDAPATNVENFQRWLDSGMTVRLVDIAKTPTLYLDYADPATIVFMDEHASYSTGDKKHLHTTWAEGIRLRNLWMKKEIDEILSKEKSPVVVLQTGSFHIGGHPWKGYKYPDSLHGIFMGASAKNTKVMVVYSEHRSDTFQTVYSEDALAAMDNPDTIVIRGGDDARHRQDYFGSFGEEIAEMQRLSASGDLPAPLMRNYGDYLRKLNQNRDELTRELRSVVAQYGPSVAPAPKLGR